MNDILNDSAFEKEVDRMLELRQKGRFPTSTFAISAARLLQNYSQEELTEHIANGIRQYKDIDRLSIACYYAFHCVNLLSTPYLPQHFQTMFAAIGSAMSDTEGMTPSSSIAKCLTLHVAFSGLVWICRDIYTAIHTT